MGHAPYRQLNIGMLLASTVIAMGCARQNFTAAPAGSSSSVVAAQARPQSVSKTIGAGKVDILIINDNSGSMSVNQSKLAAAFSTFIASLGNKDYRIAMTTTDIPATNGQLLNFGGGIRYLTPTTPNRQTLFLNTVVRQETTTCESSGYATSSCPSFDERGTYAAFMAMTRNEYSWIRPDAHQAVVILANEDVRSDASIYNNISGYGLETNDRPESLINLFLSGGIYAGKTFSAHSIIITPGDSTCKAQQSNSSVTGYYGQQYFNLSQLTINRGWGGTVHSICAADYGPAASSIGSNMNSTDRLIQLPCRPVNDSVQVTFSPAANVVPVQYDPNSRIVSVNASILAGTTWTATFTCQ
jgi:hypothetical protein